VGLSVLQGLIRTPMGPRPLNQDASTLESVSGSPDAEPLTLTLCRGSHRMRVGNNVNVQTFGPPDTVAELVGDDEGIAVQNINFQFPTSTRLLNVVVRGRIAVSGGVVEMVGGAVRGVAPFVDGGFVRSALDLTTAGPSPQQTAPGTFSGANVVFEDNGSSDAGIDVRGGAVRIRSGAAFSCNGCTFRRNTAAEGGALYAHDGNTQVFVASSTFEDNSARIVGGAVLIGSGTATFDGVTAEDNSSAGAGGAFHIGRDNQSPTVSFTGGTIRGNSANTGGGVMVQIFGGASGTATANFTDTVIENNSAQNGGGIFAAGVTTWRGGALRGNSASQLGGGAFVRQTFNLTAATLQANTAGQTGGGAFHETGSSARYGNVDVGADATVNAPDTFDGDQSAPQSFTGAVNLNCGGSGCASASP
jgi:hypothetical protein